MLLLLLLLLLFIRLGFFFFFFHQTAHEQRVAGGGREEVKTRMPRVRRTPTGENRLFARVRRRNSNCIKFFLLFFFIQSLSIKYDLRTVSSLFHYFIFFFFYILRSIRRRRTIIIEPKRRSYYKTILLSRQNILRHFTRVGAVSNIRTANP